VTILNSAKFIGQTDVDGYSGVLYSGFIPGETEASLLAAGEFQLGLLQEPHP
jgi:hypothetical protein